MRRLLAIACLLPMLTGLAAPAQAADCAVQWRVTPRLDAQPRRLDITLQFNAGNRQRSLLRLPAGWSLLQPADEALPRLLPVAGDGRLRELRHAPGERLRLAWTLSPDADSGVRLASQWFAWLGDAVLPWPEEALSPPALPAGTAPSVCLDLDPVPEAPLLLSSHGQGQTGTLRLNLPAQADAVQHALYAGGALDWRELDAQGQRLWVAQPATATGATTGPSSAGPDLDALAQRSARLIGAQRRAWRDDETAPLLLLLLPAVEGSAASGGLALHRAIALQAAPGGAPLPLETWLAEQNQRRWMSSRFGPLRHVGRDDLALRSWFSEGLADFLAHRLLLREGLWQPADYAQAFNARLARWAELPEPAADNLRTATGRAGPEALLVLPGLRGEWLGLHWHQALRQAGRPGLEPLLQSLWLPSAQARPEGPLSAPLATHRLVAALRRQLGDAPLQALTRHVDDGQPPTLDDASLGPCFRLDPSRAGTPRYQPRDEGGPACQAWLRNDAEAQAATAPSGQAQAARSGKPGKAGKSGKATKTSKPGKTSKSATKPAVKPAAKPTRR